MSVQREYSIRRLFRKLKRISSIEELQALIEIGVTERVKGDPIISGMIAETSNRIKRFDTSKEIAGLFPQNPACLRSNIIACLKNRDTEEFDELEFFLERILRRSKTDLNTSLLYEVDHRRKCKQQAVTPSKQWESSHASLAAQDSRFNVKSTAQLQVAKTYRRYKLLK